ncbi:MAG: hypothetical protein IT368_05495 [Candidatus Hydrogenedentes bacterium]|nr:hypothetical protein [Candidatus Hydrogenedentota bacterium]
MTRRTSLQAPLALLIAVGLFGCPATPGTWAWHLNGDILEIAYGNPDAGWPQLAAIHLSTSALRMIPNAESGWGPTIYLAPSLWTDDGASDQYHLGAPVTVEVSDESSTLVLKTAGNIAGLGFSNTVRFFRPMDSGFLAHITTTTTGIVDLADRPLEAFQPVHAATMRILDNQWDSQAVNIGEQEYPLPLDGQVLALPGITAKEFLLVGGDSAWKTNAPNIQVFLDRPLLLNGWANASTDPNDDNIGFWGAAEEILDQWEFSIFAAPHTDKRSE